MKRADLFGTGNASREEVGLFYAVTLLSVSQVAQQARTHIGGLHLLAKNGRCGYTDMAKRLRTRVDEGLIPKPLGDERRESPCATLDNDGRDALAHGGGEDIGRHRAFGKRARDIFDVAAIG